MLFLFFFWKKQSEKTRCNESNCGCDKIYISMVKAQAHKHSMWNCLEWKLCNEMQLNAMEWMERTTYTHNYWNIYSGTVVKWWQRWNESDICLARANWLHIKFWVSFGSLSSLWHSDCWCYWMHANISYMWNTFLTCFDVETSKYHTSTHN